VLRDHAPGRKRALDESVRNRVGEESHCKVAYSRLRGAVSEASTRVMRAARRLALFLIVSACGGTQVKVPEARSTVESGSSEVVPADSAKADRALGPSAAEGAGIKPRALLSEPGSVQCQAGARIEERGKLQSDKLDEISGLAVSRRNPGVLWVHNDSGDGPRVYALDASGALLATVSLRGAEAVDYEDMALGPGPDAPVDHLFVGDVGDNGARRADVQIYWFEEPTLEAARGSLEVSVQRLDVTYEDGPRDAEALFVDPAGGDLYIVEKGALFPFDAKVPVYRVEQADLRRKRAVARRVAEVPMGPVTAGDISADGRSIALRHYTGVRLWPRNEGQSVVEALGEPGCALPLGDLGAQGEALAFDAEASGYYTVAEGRAQRLFFHRFE
jgi:hypothetical protein